MQTKVSLTEQVYHFIRTYIDTQGYPPNIQETADGCGIPSQEVSRALYQLEQAGLLLRQPGKVRGIRLTQDIVSPVHS